MNYHHHVRTMFGTSRIDTNRMHSVRITTTELSLLIRAMDRDIVEAECEGRMVAADLLAWRVAALREAAR